MERCAVSTSTKARPEKNCLIALRRACRALGSAAGFFLRSAAIRGASYHDGCDNGKPTCGFPVACCREHLFPLRFVGNYWGLSSPSSGASHMEPPPSPSLLLVLLDTLLLQQGHLLAERRGSIFFLTYVMLCITLFIICNTKLFVRIGHEAKGSGTHALRASHSERSRGIKDHSRKDRGR